MSNADYFYLSFTVAESVSQELTYGAETLGDVARQMDRALVALYDSGLRGQFLPAFQDHAAGLLTTLRAMTDELFEAGRDLRTVVERSRLLDAQVAMGWMQESEALLPDSGGGAERIAHVTASLARLESLQHSLHAQLAEVRRQINNPVSALLGLRDDYERMEQQLNDSLARNEAAIDRLRDEQRNFEQAGSKRDGGFGRLLREAEEEAARSKQPVVEKAVPEGESGFGKLVREAEEEAIKRTSDSYARFVHRQYATGDTYGCTIYAQVSVLEAMGFDFETTLEAARTEGIQEGWYDVTTADGDGMGSSAAALGDIFDSHGIRYDRMGGPEAWSGTELPGPDVALERLHEELRQGRFAVVNFVATDVGLYSGQNVNGHTVWITGVETDATGQITSIIANDSHFGRQVTLPIDEFMSGWAQYNHQAVFAHKP